MLLLCLSVLLIFSSVDLFSAKKKTKKKVRAKPVPAPAVIREDPDKVKKELLLDPDNDIEIIPTGDGFDMYIRKKPKIHSVLLTDSPKDPKYMNHSYGLRALKHNPINGNEKRVLDEKTIEPKGKPLYFLVDSTPEPHKKFGKAFHIYLPENVVYGYAWSRNGRVPIKTGSVINLRIFSLPYTDYRAPFIDQQYTLRIREPDRFPPGLIDEFKELSDATKGKTIVADQGIQKGLDDLMNVSLSNGKAADFAFVIDTTMSMWDDMPGFKTRFPNVLGDIFSRYPQARVGLLLYRDYGESYMTKYYDFTQDGNEVLNHVSSIQIMGGMDIPEAVYEALFESINKLSWKNSERTIYLVGDAPPHPSPRGEITKDMVIRSLQKKRITVYPLIVPVNGDPFTNLLK